MRTRFFSLFSLVAVLSLLLSPAAYAQQPTNPTRQFDRSDLQKPQFSAEQMAAAQQMPQADQQAMIRGMVEGLDAKLRANPADADGWVRLIRARMVLGETDKAAAAYRDARKAFLGDARQLTALQQAARDLNVPGA